MEPGETLDGRYRVDAVLGHGAHGRTVAATRLSDERTVCIKALHFHRIGDFDAERLFEREARVLRQLDHRGVPDYVDDFMVANDGDVALYLVQELVAGQSLAAELEDHRYTEQEVRELLGELLLVVDYLHALSPPVVHRDIKPANVMRRTGDRTLVLVDFGTVKDVVRDSLGGGTVAGTFGYMAPEQFYGKASPQSDLYAVGALALTLLSRRVPADMVDARNQLAWRDHVSVGADTEALLAWLLDPDPTQRAPSARAVLDRLAGSLSPAVPARRAPSQPPVPEVAEARRGLAPALLVMGIAGALAVLAVVATTTTVTRSPEAQTAQTASPAPRGLKGLEFGMSLEQARAAWPALSGVEDLGPATDVSLLGFGPGFTVPGQRFELDTTLAGHAARCDLRFAVDATFSRATCELTPNKTKEGHLAIEQRLVGALQERYGPAHQRDEPGTRLALAWKHELTWSWADEVAELTVRSNFEDFGATAGLKVDPTSSLVVDAVSRAHEQLLDRLDDAARQAERAEEDRERRAEEARVQEELRRLEKTQKRAADDL